MLTPDELAALPDGVIRQFEQLEEEVLADIARRIRRAGVITPTGEWQMIRLQELGDASDFLKNRLRQILNLSRRELRALYLEAADRSARFDETLFQALGQDVSDTIDTPYIRQLLQAAIDQAGQELSNLTRTTAFRLKNGRTLTVQQAFQYSLDHTQWQITSGAVDPERAIHQSVKELADSGLRFVEYGSGTVRSVEAAVRTCVVTGIGQLTGQISERNAQALGTDIVETTAHPGARPEHRRWQGKWFSLRGDTPEYPNLAKATGYGQADGLKGANCRHDFHAVIPGLSAPAYTREELDKLNHPKPIAYEGRQYDSYQATQKLRQIERSIRGSKRRLIGYEAAGLEADYTAESVRLRRLRGLYQDFSRASGLPTQEQRASVAGWGRREGIRAAAAARPAENTVD